MSKENKNIKPYMFGILFYFIFFALITGGIAVIFYIITIPLAFTPTAENFWRKISGIRPLRLKEEKERLLPLFKEVYEGAIGADPDLSKGIKIYIKEDMSINTFAFGRSTLVLTKGSIQLLSDESIKGLIAHEFGHFSHYDTIADLLITFGNFPLSFIVTKLANLKNQYDDSSGLIISCFKALYNAVYYLFKGVQTIGDLFLKHIYRKREYMADDFAFKSGFGKELAGVLTQIYHMSFDKPKSVKEQLKSSHPPITLRIEELENAVY